MSEYNAQQTVSATHCCTTQLRTFPVPGDRPGGDGGGRQEGLPLLPLGLPHQLPHHHRLELMPALCQVVTLESPVSSRYSLTSFLCSNSWLASLQQSERVPESFPTHPSYTDAEVWSHVLSPLCRQLSDLDMCILCFPPLKVTALLEDQNYSHPQWCLITVQVVAVLLFG